MLRYTKWEDWSWIITKGVQCLEIIKNNTSLFKDTRHYWWWSKTSLLPLSVSQHMHKITNLWKFELNRSSISCEIIMKENPALSHFVCAFRCSISRPQNHPILRSRNQIRGKLLISQKLYVTSEGAVSHNVLYYQQLHYSLPSEVLC